MSKWLFILLLTFALFIFFVFHTFRSSPDPDGPFLDVHTNISLDKFDNEWQSEAAKWTRCSLSGCVQMQLDQCVIHPGRRLSIYVQPLLRVFDKNGKYISCSAGDGPSKEFLEMREIIRRSDHFEPDPAFACLVLPGIDSTSLAHCSPAQFFALLKTAQSLLPHSSNLLIVNFHITDQYLTIPSPFPGIFVSAQHSRLSLRPGLDVGIPYPNNNPDFTSLSTERTINLLIILPNLDESLRDELIRLFGNDERVQFVQICPNSDDQPAQFCDAKSQIQLLKSIGNLISSSNFVLIPADGLSPIPQQFVWLALRHGVIPVVLSDLFLPPFFDSIGWYRFSFLFPPTILPELPRILRSVSYDRIAQMRAIGSQIFTTHFASLELILNSTIDSLEGRIVPGRAKTKSEWNTGSQRLLPIDEPAICESGQKGEAQTLIMLVEDDQGKRRIGPILEELQRQHGSDVRIDRLIIACRSENCPPSIEETSRPLPFALGILPISEMDLDLFTDPAIHSTGPALIFMDFSRQFASKWSISAIISDAFRVWSSHCHSILLFPPPPTAGPYGQVPTFGSVFSIIHKHLISHFASSKVPPICSSSPSSHNAISPHFAICHISEN